MLSKSVWEEKEVGLGEQITVFATGNKGETGTLIRRLLLSSGTEMTTAWITVMAVDRARMMY